MCCGWVACSQHFAGLPGGRVGGQDLAPGGLGGQLFDGDYGDALQPWCVNAGFFPALKLILKHLLSLSYSIYLKILIT